MRSPQYCAAMETGGLRRRLGLCRPEGPEAFLMLERWDMVAFMTTLFRSDQPQPTKPQGR